MVAPFSRPLRHVRWDASGQITTAEMSDLQQRHTVVQIYRNSMANRCSQEGMSPFKRESQSCGVARWGVFLVLGWKKEWESQGERSIISEQLHDFAGRSAEQI